jgi:hypothetical protein
MLVGAPNVILRHLILVVVGAASAPVAPFAIGAAPSKVTSRTAARWERSETVCDTMVAGDVHLSTTTLDEYGIDVRWSVRTYLIGAYHTRYEFNIDALTG